MGEAARAWGRESVTGRECRYNPSDRRPLSQPGTNKMSTLKGGN